MAILRWILRLLGIERERAMYANERARAWFVVKVAADGTDRVRTALRDLDHGDRADLAVVRIDSVQDGSGEHALVIPVDAAMTEGDPFAELRGALEKLGLGDAYQVLRVVEHEYEGAGEYRPPHLAAGYITPDELKADGEHNKSIFDKRSLFSVIVSHGRQIHSPGFTPWG